MAAFRVRHPCRKKNEKDDGDSVVHPSFEGRCPEAPQFAHMNGTYLSTMDEPLQCSWMHLQDGCGLAAIEQRFLEIARKAGSILSAIRWLFVFGHMYAPLENLRGIPPTQQQDSRE
jgi:hypothetical protein